MHKNKAIKIYLIGGLGNVLFQINYGEFLEKKGFQVEYCDILLRRNVITSALRWTIHGTVSDLKTLNFYEEYRFTPFKIFEFLSIILSKLARVPVFGAEYCKHDLMTSKQKTRVICGYFMLGVPISFRLVSRLRKQLLDSPAETDSKTAVVHYRGGDYANSHFPCLDNYFKKTLLQLGCAYYVVTNDKESARKIFCNDINFLGFKGSSVIEDFSRLASASILVQSSSTFSWWAAEISRADVVYQPEPFFNHIKWVPETSCKTRVGICYQA